MVPEDFVSDLVQPFSAFGSKQKCVPRRLQKETGDGFHLGKVDATPHIVGVS